MTLAETCDRIEAALKYKPMNVLCPREFRCKCGHCVCAKELLRTLVELGDTQIDRAYLADRLAGLTGDADDMHTEDLALDLAGRWDALRARAEEAVGK